MITLLGVLLIIGSCSSSKSVNTSEVTVGDGKLEVIFAPQFTYQDMVITLWKYNSSTGSYVKQGYADIDAPMLLSSSDTMKITGTFRYSSGGTTVTDYINDFRNYSGILKKMSFFNFPSIFVMYFLIQYRHQL